MPNWAILGGLFDLAAAGYKSEDTIIIGATDGVGTKLCVAHLTKKHESVGIDLVAICVNDLIVAGGEPLFFLWLRGGGGGGGGGEQHDDALHSETGGVGGSGTAVSGGGGGGGTVMDHYTIIRLLYF